MALRVADIAQGSRVQSRARIIQRKTGRPVQFEIAEHTRNAVECWIARKDLRPSDYIFPSRKNPSSHLSKRQYARIVDYWVEGIGLDPALYGTHSLRRTKASLIYRKTKNLRAVQILLGHTSLESTVRYLGIDEDDAPNSGNRSILILAREHFHLRVVESFIKTGETQCEHGV
jgi:integrase